PHAVGQHVVAAASVAVAQQLLLRLSMGERAERCKQDRSRREFSHLSSLNVSAVPNRMLGRIPPTRQASAPKKKSLETSPGSNPEAGGTAGAGPGPACSDVQ